MDRSPKGITALVGLLTALVWREVVPGDHVCVTAETHDQVWQDNRLAASRRVG